MRIAIFSDNFYPELSGITDSILRTGKELARRGHRIAFFAPRYSPANYAALNLPYKEIDLGANISIHRFASLPYPTGTGQGRVVVPLGFRALRVRAFNPDVIHVHLPLGIGLEGLLAAQMLRRPLVGTNHTPTAEFMHYTPFSGESARRRAIQYVTWFYNRPQFVSAPSKSIFREMRPYGFRASHAVISNPLDTKLFLPLRKRIAMKRKFGLSGFTLLYAGRLAPEKHIDAIIHAVAFLKEELPDVSLAIAGNGMARQSLETLARERGVADRVKFLGFLPEEQLVAAYNAADAFVMMSTAETQSIAMMHAMLVELPVVAARAWGLEEYVNERNDFLIPPGDIRALTEKIKELYKRPGLRSALGKNGRSFAIQFSPAVIADRWETIYENARTVYNQKV